MTEKISWDLTQIDRFEETGRGTIIVVEAPCDGYELLGKTVRIGGDLFVVSSVESQGHPKEGKLICLVVRDAMGASWGGGTCAYPYSSHNKE